MSNSLILYMEDEENDVMMLQFALKRLGISNPFKALKNGEEALAYLKGTGQYGDRTQYPIPGLILLDMNIPRVSGMKVLEWIRQQSQFASLPVVIYTSSELPAEIEKARQLGANDYIVKPSGMEKIMSAVQKIKDRWLSPIPETVHLKSEISSKGPQTG